jgi:hypothetical protein
MDKNDILFGALMGSKSLPSLERFKLVQTELNNNVLPPIPFLPIKNETNIINRINIDAGTYNDSQLWQADKKLSFEQMYFPMRLSLYSEEDKDPNIPLANYKKLPRFLFPFEPLVSISSGNNILESIVSVQGDMHRGTVKERFFKKDWDIIITGVLIGASEKGKPIDCYPNDDLKFLFEYLKTANSLKVVHHQLNELNITHLVVYDFSFPFTKGENVQAYELKCKSDNKLNLIIPDSEF